MSMPASPAVRYRAGALLAVVAAVFTALVSMAPAASAHHAEIVATTGCAGQVDWTASAWATSDPSRRVNHDVKVWYVVDDGADAGATADVGRNHFGSDNGYQFSGAFPWPSADASSITVRVQEQVGWGENENLGSPGSPRSTTVERPPSCPGVPQVSSSVACANGNGDITITLAAIGGSAPVVFVVTDPRGGAPVTKTVAVGATDTVVLTGFADGPVTIPVTADGAAHPQSLTVTCDRVGVPEVSSSIACANGNGDVTVTLANTGGDKAVVFVVTDPRGGAPVTKTVAVGATDTVVFTGFADGPVTIPVTADGTHVDQSLTVACDRPGLPKVSAGLVCANGNGDVTVTLANTGGDKAVVFVVTDPRGGAPVTKTVAVGATDTVVLTGFADGPVTIPVTADGTHVDQSLTVACDRPGLPEVSAGLVCANGNGDVTVTLANTGGDKAVVFVVTDPRGGAPVTKTVAVGATDTVVLTGFADGPVTIPVTADGADAPQSLTVACDRPGVPSVKVTASCVDFDGRVVVVLRNTDGTEPITFVVTPPGGPAKTRTVAVGDATSVAIDGLPDGPVTIAVTADGVALPQTITVDCDHPGTPSVSGGVECAAQGGKVVVHLANLDPAGRAEAIAFVVTDPRTNTPHAVSVPAGTTSDVVLTGFPDGSVTVPVSADGVALPAITATVDCARPSVAEAVVSCTEGGVVIEIVNGGPTPVEVTVKKDDETVTTVTVDPDTPAEVVVPFDEDETGKVEVLSEGVVLTSLTPEYDCVENTTTTGPTTTESTPPTSDASPSTTVKPGDTTPSSIPVTVLDSTQERPATTLDPTIAPTAVPGTLPLTGARSTGLAFAGLLLLAAGTMLTLGSRAASAAAAREQRR